MSEINNEAVEQEAALVEQVEQQHEQLENFSRADMEEIAKANGWKEDGPNDALTFMKNGGVYRRQHVNTIKDLQDQVQKMETVLAEQVFRTVKSEEQRLKDQIKQAVDNLDSDKAIELTERLMTISRPAPEVKDTSRVYEQWIQDNSWYSDPDLKGLADDIHDAEKARMGVNFDAEKVLAKVSEKMQRHIKKPENPNRTRATGETGGNRQKSASIRVKDLSPEESAHFEDFRKAGIAEDTLLRSIAKARSMA